MNSIRPLSVATCVAALVLVVGCGKQERFPLVRANRAAPIVIPAEAEASTELAAKELADYVEKISGVRPEIKVEKVGGGGERNLPRVEIGTLNTMKDLPEAIVRKFEASPSWESYVIACDKDVLRIVGRDEVADLYGTYHFLEDKLGVRWFKEWTKDDPGDYYPSQATLEIAPFEKFRAPSFSSRWLCQTGSSCGYCPKRGIEWTARLGLQNVPYGGGNLSHIDNMIRRHADPKDQGIVRELHDAFKPRVSLRQLHLGGGHMMTHDAVPAKKYFKTHPEYFAEVKGERVDRDSRACLSNKDVQRLVAEDICRRLDKTGGKGSYLFGLMDGRNNLCECKQCQALDTPEEKKKPLNDDISTRVHTAARNIAAQVYAKYPDATLYNWAYSVYRTPPTTVKLDPRTGVQLCIHGRCYGHSIDDPTCERNPKLLKWVKDWMKVASWGKTYEYANCSGNYYCPTETIYAHDLQYYHSIGLRGWGEEMGYTDSVHVPILPKGQFDKRKEKSLTNWQWFYVCAKLSWDIGLDPDAVLADAESKYYGPAYPAMKEYQALRRTNWKNAPVCWGYGGYPMTDERTRLVLNVPGLKEKLLKLLDEAEKLAAGDTIRLYRVRKDREWLQRYWIEPNEKVRAAKSNALRAPAKTSEIVVDGNGNDATWGLACWAEGCTPDRVDVGILSDAENLYFQFKVLGTPDLLKSDRIGVVLYAPDMDNTGKAYPFTCDLQRCAKGTDTGYTAELKVPTDGIRKLRRGEIWHVKFFRNPDGNEPDIRYPLEIGEPKLANGSFEDLDEKGIPKGWGNLKKEHVVPLDGKQHAVRSDDYFFYGLSGLRSFGSAKEERKVRVSFRAWGSGKMSAWFLRYHDIPKPGGGYERQMPTPNVTICVAEVSEKPQYFSYVAKIPAGEWVSLYFRRAWEKDMTKGLFIDDVTVTDED